MSRSKIVSAFLGVFVVCFLVSGLFAKGVALTPQAKTDQWWVDRHAANVAQMEKGDIDLLMIGDSITHGWEGAGKLVWDSYYAHRKAINLGFGGDRTEHVLWRLENLPLDKINPKAAVLMIGTNNVGHNSSTPEEAAQGVQAIVTKLEKQFPNMKILVLNVFPRDAKPEDQLRQKVNQINALLPDLLKGKDNVTLLDINQEFLDADGNLPKEVMNDFLHPGASGYESWALAMEPVLYRLLGEGNPALEPGDRAKEEWWTKRHENNVEVMNKGNIDFLMVGDSITHGWDNQKPLVDKYFAPFRPINLGFSGDQTQHVLWRLENLPLDKINPKAAMIMIGTNNTGNRKNTPWMIAEGVGKIVEKLHGQYPEMKIIVLHVFPRDEKPDGWLRHRVEEVNLALPRAIHDITNVKIVDINPGFLTDDGVLSKEIMPDALHPNTKGYEIWGDSILPILEPCFAR